MVAADMGGEEGAGGLARPDVLERLMSLPEESGSVQIKTAFESFLRPLGGTSFTCYRVPASGQPFEPCLLMDTRPEEWTRHYLEQDHVRFDAVVHEGFRTSAPFTWSEVYRRRNVDSREKRIQDERSAMGLKEALVVPIYEGRGFAGAVSVSCEEPPDLQSRQALTMGCVFLHHRLIAMQSETYGDDAGLTRREVECLNWAAEGKSDWEIGKILRISSKTVNYHIENVKRKFGVATRVQAIVVALRQGRLG